MNLYLNRCYSKDTYIIGKLFIEDDYFCDTLEPPFEDAHPAINAGTYKVSLDFVSPAMVRKKRFYYKFCNYKVPRLLDVPGRSGILIHIGNDSSSTSGCILVGKNTQVGKVLSSFSTFVKLYKLLETDKDNIYIHIYDTIINR